MRPQRAPSAAEPAEPKVPTRLRVLLAEDDVEMRRLLVSALRKAGCEIVEAQHGARLLELMHSEVLDASRPRIDVIVSDVRMPGVSGLDALADLRRDDAQTPVILITAFGDPETHAEAYRLGAVAVFNKPFDIDDLRTLVASFAKQA